MKQIKIGFFGIGAMGQMAHLRNYLIEPECTVVAVSDPRIKTAREVAKRFNIPRVYESGFDMVEKEDLDAIVASQPFRFHISILPKLLKAKKPVFIEKPLAASVESGKRIVEEVKSSGTFIMVGYHKRSDPAVMLAKQKIEEFLQTNEIGTLRYVRITMPPGDWIQEGFCGLINEKDPYPTIELEKCPSDMSNSSFEIFIRFINYYIHQVNLMRYLLGEDYNVVYADKNETVLVCETESGKHGVIETNPYKTDIGWQESALVCFEKGWIRIDLPAPLVINQAGRLTIYCGNKEKEIKTTTFELPPIHAMRQQARNFIKAVKGEILPLTTAEEALKDLNVARQYLEFITGE